MENVPANYLEDGILSIEFHPLLSLVVNSNETYVLSFVAPSPDKETGYSTVRFLDVVSVKSRLVAGYTMTKKTLK